MDFRNYLLMSKMLGGGSVEGVHYVTFMDETGTVELYKRPVADGDDCADPVERLLMDEPTKKSTVQYNYTFSGWATTAGGSADNNALKTVTEDRIVYVAFAESLVYYTISYYDEDGTTLLTSENLTYGSKPNYTPTKSGYAFLGWTPTVIAVTGDASYTAQWMIRTTFAEGSWEHIAAVAKTGKASSVFSLGDTRVETINGEEITLEIVGFNHDNLSDGTGKAGITVIAKTLFAEPMKFDTVCGNLNQYKHWSNCSLRTWCNGDLFNSLPTELSSVIKAVDKLSDSANGGKLVTTSDKIWVPSREELTTASFSDSSYKWHQSTSGQGTKYAWYTSASRRKKYVNGKTINYLYLTRSTAYNNSSTYKTSYALVINADDTVGVLNKSYVPIGFCI